jgi:predicted SAM-dependent methyltransferase
MAVGLTAPTRAEAHARPDNAGDGRRQEQLGSVFSSAHPRRRSAGRSSSGWDGNGVHLTGQSPRTPLRRFRSDEMWFSASVLHRPLRALRHGAASILRSAHLSAGVRASLKSLMSELRIQRRHRVAVRRARLLSERSQLKLHLGSGQKNKAGWVNIDFDSSADLRLDLREPFPFGDASVTAIYSEHLVEHIDYPLGMNHLLAESLRVLAPGGVFTTGVPDLGEALEQYRSGELPLLLRRWEADPDHQWVDPWVWSTPAHYLNWFFRQGDEHRYAYDLETLTLVLTQAGFTGVRQRPFDPGQDSADRRDGTLYVEAVKPLTNP